MAAKLIHEIPEVAPDVGPHGYTQDMYVYLNQAPDADALAAAGVTRAHAQACLDHGLFRVGFSSEPGGTGIFGIVEMVADDARYYPLETKVRFHFRKNREIGFGELVAITPLSSPEAEHAAGSVGMNM